VAPKPTAMLVELTPDDSVLLPIAMLLPPLPVALGPLVPAASLLPIAMLCAFGFPAVGPPKALAFGPQARLVLPFALAPWPEPPVSAQTNCAAAGRAPRTSVHPTTNARPQKRLPIRMTCPLFATKTRGSPCCRCNAYHHAYDS
jgi:hypothetical protein